ncbi:glycosyltransferase family 4 protein [Bergeyella sp. RCAD1439]|uniref:glycosyltransferase family 4 protein n=1 Tax=Bergeyella anatis TaxID=3113737 RepID=UPI002E1842FE|nr:glycosyltransferase family 1 protein [Bergeyella sp. RCAD1439]
MKIAFDAKRFFHNASGLGNYSRDLVRVLASFYPENTYLLLSEKASERGKAILALPNVDFKETSNGFLARQRQMGIDAQNLGATIFHGLSGELPLRWSRSSIKKIVTIHDLIFMRYPQYYRWFDRKIHFWKFRNAAQQADLVIAISEQTKRDIMHYLQIPESKIRVVYQGCHQAFKEVLNEEFLSRLREKYPLPKRFILNVGTIEPRKNLLNIVKSLKGTGIPLVVVGKPQKKYFEKVQKEIRKGAVDVLFLQGVTMEELAGLYRLADVFVYPSIFEGFGIPVIEALFSGTPVITSNTSCLPEAGGEAALYVHPNSVEDLRAKIAYLWENESERIRRREKGLAFVKKFNDEAIARNLMAVYREVLES